MKLMVINGPNLNLLGLREPELYGKADYTALCAGIEAYAAQKRITVDILQSNHEGELIGWVQQAYFRGYDGVILNPAGYTHTSVALLDAVKAIPIPVVEVHLTDPDQREDFRRVSFVRQGCLATCAGLGFASYYRAMDLLLAHSEQKG